MIAAAFNPKCYGQVFNLGSGKGIKLLDGVKKIIKITGRGKYKVESQSLELKKIESGDFVTDISKINKFTGWKPLYDFEEGIKKTLDYSRDQETLLSQLLRI